MASEASICTSPAGNPPPLPPRRSSQFIIPDSGPPPPYSSVDTNHPYLQSANALALPLNDPRSSSTQSLVPLQSREGRRQLLLIYIHGFQGAETSFQSFPAHVHNILAITLAHSHVVHSKIYPRYKSRGQIEEASENFSKWLAPHESTETDVVLLGHSMGGLLAAEVALLPPVPWTAPLAFRHRILGTVNFDVPFLGMHPGVIKSGLASLFRRSDDEGPADGEPSPLTSASSTTLDTDSEILSVASNTPARHDTLFSYPQDPNFNPKYDNDVRVPVRKGWRNIRHFVNKHSDNIIRAAKKSVYSTMEFGGAMADYPELKGRYARIRALEVEDEAYRCQIVGRNRPPPRVRFVNYYTASSGRPKNGKSRSPGARRVDFEEKDASVGAEVQSLDLSAPNSIGSYSRTNSPRISIEEHRDEAALIRKVITPELDPAHQRIVESRSGSEGETISSTADSVPIAELKPHLASLPPISDEPPEPAALDFSLYSHGTSQELAQRDHERSVKAYQQAIEDRNAAISHRRRLEEATKETAEKESQLARRRGEQPELDSALNADSAPTAESISDTNKRGRSTLSKPPTSHPQTATDLVRTSTPPADPLHLTASSSNPLSIPRSRSPSPAPSPSKPPKEHKFCMLPRKDEGGNRDPTWVRVYMPGVDEIGAHTTLFALSDTYEMLVGDVAARIEDWVREDAIVRARSRAGQRG